MTARARLGRFASKRRCKTPKRHSNPSPGVDLRPSDAEIRHLVAAEASTARGHEGLMMMHQRLAHRMTVAGWVGWADYHNRMADGHMAMVHSLESVARLTRARKLGYRR